MNYHDKSKEELIELLNSFEIKLREKSKESFNQQYYLYPTNIKELVKAEAESRYTSSLLTDLIINFKEGILLENSERKIEMTNQLFCDMFSVPIAPNFLIGTDCSSSAEQTKVNFDNPEKFISDINNILNDRKPVFNDVLRLVDGRVFERDYIPTFIDGRYGGHLWKYRDVTERINTEKALFESQELYQSMLDASPDVILITDIEGNIQFVSNQVLKMFGYEYSKYFEGRSLFEFLTEKSQIEAKEQIKGMFSQKKRSADVYKAIKSDKTICDIEVKAEFIRNESGDPVRLIFVVRDITERIKAEETIKLSEERYRLLFANNPQPMWIYDLETLAILEVNNSSINQYGYTREEFLNRTIKDIHPPEDVHDLIDDVYDNNSENKNLKRVWRHLWKNGELRYVEITAQSVDFIGRKARHVLINDITEQTQVTIKLARSEERFRQVVEQSEEVVWEINCDGLYTYVSPIAEQIYGYTVEQLVDKMYFYDLLPEEMREEIKEVAFEKFKCKDSFRNFINQIEKQNGEIAIILTNGIPVYNKNGDFMGYRGVDIDITKRVEAEQELLKFRTISDEANYGAFITSLDGNFEYVNNAFASMFGWNAKELLQMNYKMLLSEDHFEKVEEINNLIKRNSGFVAEEFSYLRKDGSVFPGLMSANLIYDKHKNPLYLSGTLIDVTQKKKYEKDIIDLNQNLESKVQLRTIQLEKVNYNLTAEIAERKRFEVALKESELKYRSVVENLHDVVFQIDDNAQWLFLSHSWELITGFTVEESLGKELFDFVHPDDRDLNQELLQTLLTHSKDTCRHEARYIKKDGGYCWIDVFARLALNDTNEVVGIYGSLRDITEQKRAKEFENEMLLLSAQLTGIKHKEINNILQTTIQRIARFLNADRCYIFEIHDSGDLMSNTFEWCIDGIRPEIDNLKDLPLEVFPEWMKSLQHHRNVIIPSVSDLPEEWANERDTLEPQGIKSLIALPLLNENNLIGFVGLDSVTNFKQYSQTEINNLKVWSSMLSSLIMNKRTESLLEISRQNFETFFNTIDDFLWVMDDSGRLIHINNTVVERLGYSPDELLFQSGLVIHPESRRKEALKYSTDILQGKTTLYSVPLVTKDGHLIPVETRVKYGFWNGLPSVFGVSKDVSQIQLSEEKFSKAFRFNSAPMVISSSKNGVFIDVNDALVNTLGYTRDEIIGKTSLELNLYENISTREIISTSFNSNSNIKELEIILLNKSGEKIIGLFSTERIYVGNELCFLSMFVDITERKKAEKEMRKAQLDAEKANMAKSEFLSRMSHELRTPMNSILGFAQILELGELNNGQKKSVNHILKSGKHLLNLINEVLDISRIEAGRLSFDIEKIEVNTILNEMSDIISPLAFDRGVKISNIVNPTKLFVNLDKQRLNQILLNLLHNAVKYNKPSGLVTLSAKKMNIDNSNRALIRISITDTGNGISDEDIPKLFTPFERVGTHHATIEGTGLGLAVVKKLVESMGGVVGVESEVGVGSTFWIQFEVDNSQEAIDNSDLVQVGTNEFSIRKAKVLYIEDNLSNIELVEELFAIQIPDVQLISSINGDDAVQLAIEHKPKVILLDINLPKIQGDEVLILLQNNILTKEIPVIILSADAMQNQIDRMLLAGAKKYIIKPLDVSIFMKSIVEFL